MAVRAHVSSPEYQAVIQQTANTDPGHGDKRLIQHPLAHRDRKGLGYEELYEKFEWGPKLSLPNKAK